MFIPGPPIQPLMQFKNVSTYLSELDGIDTISGGVGVYGSAAAYALVWELGSLRLKHPGPKTLWSINRNDKIAILTKQAPRGYVGILSDQFWPIIEEELSKVSFSGSNIRLKLEVAMDNASQRIAKLVADKAPVDSGDLRSQIMAVDSDEASFLSQANSIESTGTLIL